MEIRSGACECVKDMENRVQCLTSLPLGKLHRFHFNETLKHSHEPSPGFPASQ